MPGNPLVRFDEGRVGRTARCRPLSYSTENRFRGGQGTSRKALAPAVPGLKDHETLRFRHHPPLRRPR